MTSVSAHAAEPGLVEAAAPAGDAAAAGETRGSEVAADGEVIVTAERRAASVQKTPVAVGVLGPADIAREGVKKLYDAQGSIAGLYLGSYGSNMQTISIRGIGGNDPGVLAAVGYYLDDVYLGRSFGRGQVTFPDIERIEVLRGPQGTLYGQNTTGGAIKFVSRDPSLVEASGWVSASIGNYGALETASYVSTPIVAGRLSAQFAFSHRQTDGDTYNAFRKRTVNRVFLDQWRAKLRWSPSDRLDVVFALDGTRDASDNYIGTPNANTPDGIVKPRRIYANTDTQMLRKDLGQTLRINLELNENFALKSVTAHRRDQHSPHPWDSDGLPTDIFGWSQDFVEKIFSQEVQLSADFDKLKLTVGANYYDDSFDFKRVQWQLGNYTRLVSYLTYKSYALYAQGNYRITPSLGITLGGRFGWERQTFEAASYRSNAAFEQLARNYAVSGVSLKENNFTPKVGIDFQVTPTIYTYASYTVGEKSGGYNRAAGTLLVASIPVEPEKVRTTEVGAKIQAFDRRLTFNIAAFYNKFDEYQATVTNPIIDGAVVNGNVVVNAGNAHTKGVEIEASLRPVQGLQLRGTATFLRTRFDSFVNPTGAASSDFTGNQVPNAPRHLLNAGFDYTLPLAGLGGSVRVNASYTYIPKTYGDIANTDAFRGENRKLLTAGIDYTSADERWNLQFLVKNALDVRNLVGVTINPALGTNNSSYGEPRTILGTVRYQF